mmetsp:Transcript_78035/g.180964  ORF Transcript_78035/g.180964 Transcript_78035/m.180964 type:complete len:206 (-) Transcript_78035:1102-1719(-)
MAVPFTQDLPLVRRPDPGHRQQLHCQDANEQHRSHGCRLFLACHADDPDSHAGPWHRGPFCSRLHRPNAHARLAQVPHRPLAFPLHGWTCLLQDELQLRQGRRRGQSGPANADRCREFFVIPQHFRLLHYQNSAHTHQQHHHRLVHHAQDHDDPPGLLHMWLLHLASLHVAFRAAQLHHSEVGGRLPVLHGAHPRQCRRHRFLRW